MDSMNYYGLNTLPISLSSILNENTDAMDYYTNMDDSARSELINYANDFQSKEELERYIYYLTDDNFR